MKSIDDNIKKIVRVCTVKIKEGSKLKSKEAITIHLIKHTTVTQRHLCMEGDQSSSAKNLIKHTTVTQRHIKNLQS